MIYLKQLVANIIAKLIAFFSTIEIKFSAFMEENLVKDYVSIHIVNVSGALISLICKS